jgi:hypothetical protein
VGKLDKCLHCLSILIAWKFIIGLIIQYVSLNNTEKIIIIIPKSNIFTKTKTQGSLQVGDLSSCNLLTETNNFVLCAILLSCLVSKLQKPPSLGLKPSTGFQGCGLCSCNLLAETNNFGLGAVLLSCLVSKLQKPSSLGKEPRTVFQGLAFDSVISSSKKTTLVLVPFLYRA